MTQIENVLTDDEVYTFLDRAISIMLSRTDIPLTNGERGRLYGWYWGYYGRAAVDMLSATSDARFATLLERTIESLLELRDDQLALIDDERGVVFPSWGTRYKTGERSNEITTAGLITQPMFEYAHLANKKWIADAAAESVFAFANERNYTDDGRYYFNHQSQHVVEAINHSSLYGAALTHAARSIDDPWLMETAIGIYAYHQSFTDNRGNGIAWPYAPTPEQDKSKLPSEAIWKAAASIELPIALAEVDHPGARDFTHRVAESIISHPEMKSGNLPQFIGHDRRAVVDHKLVSGGLTSFISAFLQIEHKQLRSTILDLMDRHPQMFPNSWKGGSRAMVMAWAHLRKLRAE